VPANLGRPIKVVVGNYNEATLPPPRQAKFRRFLLFRLTRGSLEIIEWKRFARHWHALAHLSSRRGNRIATERKGAIRVDSDGGKISSPIFSPRYCARRGERERASERARMRIVSRVRFYFMLLAIGERRYVAPVLRSVQLIHRIDARNGRKNIHIAPRISIRHSIKSHKRVAFEREYV